MKTAPAIRLGLVGCGQVVERFHLPALRRAEGLRVVALADVDERRCRAIGDRFGVPRRHADASSLIASDVEAVAVCLPPARNAAVALEVLRAGKHLFLEKPIALSIPDADRLVEEAHHAGVVSMTGFNLRWHRAARQVRDLIQSGRLGRVRRVHSVFSHRQTPPPGHWRTAADGGGQVLLDLGVHHFDLLRFLLGGDLAEISADASPDGSRARVEAALPGGARAEMQFSVGSGLRDANDLELATEAGNVVVSFYRTLGLRGGQSGLGPLAALSPTLLAERWRGGAYPSSYRRQWRHFADAVRSGAPGDASLEDGRAALSAALAAIDSARRNTPPRPDLVSARVEAGATR